jgi:AraC family transcriptional regulator
MRHVTLASGPGWSVSDFICSAGPHDRPFEERHESVCIALVTQGTFQYRSALGSAVLAPGALLLGNEGTRFECGHEHAVGDRCLSFHFAPDYMEEIAAAVPGVRHAVFALPRLPSLPALMPILASAEGAGDEHDRAAFEEIALRLGGAVLAALADAKLPAHGPSHRDARRITRALRRIEAEAQEPLTVTDLAREAAMSPYHFLRVFNQVAGMTPHQFVLRTRLHRAAVRLRQSDESVLAIASEAGFNDLSTFNRRFRKIMGCSPSVFRVDLAVQTEADGLA